MIQFQIVIDFKEGCNQIIVNVLEREDANNQERELARHLEDLHRTILMDIRDQLLEGDIEISEITSYAPGPFASLAELKESAEFHDGTEEWQEPWAVIDATTDNLLTIWYPDRNEQAHVTVTDDTYYQYAMENFDSQVRPATTMPRWARWRS